MVETRGDGISVADGVKVPGVYVITSKRRPNQTQRCSSSLVPHGADSSAIVAAVAATLRDPDAPTGPRELTYACAWLGVRVEVLRFSPRSTSPSVSTVPPCDISHTADGTPLIFAGSLAMWWPDPTSDVGHWEAFTGNHTTSETPATPPVSRTPPSRCLDPDSGPALPEFVISRPTVINVPDRTNVSQGPPRVTGASPRGPHATDKRPHTL